MINPDTFCSTTWFNIRLDWDGKYRPCCHLDTTQSEFTGKKDFSLNDTSVDQWMTSDYSVYLRKNLTEGKKLPECRRCWFDEEHGFKSLRMSSNSTTSQINEIDPTKTWMASFVKNKSFNDYRIVTADVKLSNVCNFSCVMCGPHFSSKLYDRWVKDPENKFIQQKLNAEPRYLIDIKKTYQDQRGHQHLVDILNQPLTHLKVLGGEPLLDKEMFKILESQPDSLKSRLSLLFVTNGSQDMVSAADRLQGYRDVTFSVSIDAYGQLQEYIRPGCDWQVVSDNVIRAHQKGLVVGVSCVLQALNVLGIRDLLQWSQTHGIDAKFNLLDEPEILAISVLPQEIKTRSLEILDTYQACVDENSSVFNKIIELKKIISGTDSNEHLYTEFLEYINWHQKILPIKLQDILPIFYNIESHSHE
jgi:sulfatase maturation enzyme AslB (radical SAM superfamily)